MASDLQQSLQRIGEKSRFLTQRYRVVEQERRQALEEVARLRKELEARNREIQTMKMKIDYLTMVSSVAPDHDAVLKVKTVISGLVRDIDRCIADLND